MDNGLLTIATCHCDVKRSNGALGWGCSREETAAVAIKRWATAAVRKRPVTNTGSLHSTRALELSLSLSTDSLSLSLYNTGKLIGLETDPDVVQQRTARSIGLNGDDDVEVKPLQDELVRSSSSWK